MSSRTTVVIMTRNRSDDLDRTLQHLCRLQPRPPVIMIDNGSSDDTVERVSAKHPWVEIIRSRRNLGAVARNLGVRAADTPYIAFCDDDSWWSDGALQAAESILDNHPRLGVVVGKVLVGPEQRIDPMSVELAQSPLGRSDDLPGPSVLGFQACGAVVRREAFDDAGGFNPIVAFPGEEEVLSYDLSARGWQLCYVEDIVAHHHPSSGRPPSSERAAAQLANAVLAAVMRRPPEAIVRLLGQVRRHPRAIPRVLRRLPQALLQRRRLPPHVEQQLDLLEHHR